MVRVPEVEGVLDREGMRGLELLLLLSEATYGNPISKNAGVNTGQPEQSAGKVVPLMVSL